MSTAVHPAAAVASRPRQALPHRMTARPRSAPMAPPVRTIRPTGVDAEFLQSLVEDARQQRSPLRKALRVVARNRRKASRLFMAIMLLVGIGVFAAVGTADKAEAIPFVSEYCSDWRVEQSKDNARHGIIAYGDTTDEDGKLANTTWAQYGLAGINWDVFWVECSSFGTWLMGGISDMLFTLPATLNGMVITFFQWTFQGEILNTFIEPRTDGGNAPLDVIVSALQLQLFLQFLGLMTIVGALVLFWRGIIKGAGLADILGKVLVMILIGAFGMYFGANASYILKTLNDNTNNIMGLTFAAFAQATCEAAPGDDNGTCGKNADADDAPLSTDVACVDSQTDEDGVPKTVYVPSVDCIGQVMYNALIFTPWATGELGPMVPSDTKDNKPVEEKKFTDNYRERMDLAVKILRWQAYSRAEVDLIEDGKGAIDNATGMVTSNGDGQKMDQRDYMGEQKGRWDCYVNHPKNRAFEILMKDFAGGDGIKNAVWDKYEAKRDDTDGVEESSKDAILFNACEIAHMGHEEGTWWKLGLDEGDTPAASWNDLYDHVAAGKQSQFKAFSGQNFLHRFQTAIMSMITGLAMGFVILAVAIAYLILQIATIVFAMLAPLACLIGIIPVYGSKIFLKWGELFIGTFLKRIGLAVFVGFLMTMYTMVLMLPFEMFMQVATLLGIALVGLVYRKKIMELAGMGGVNQALATAGGAAAKGSWSATKGTAKFGRNRADGARLRYQRAKSTYQSLEDTNRKNGKKLGKGRRMWAAALSGASVGGGRRNYKKQARQTARRLGGTDARKKGKNAGYVRRRGE